MRSHALAQGQANNAATSAGATQAGIYDLIEQDQRQAAESALDRLIDIDLEYVNQMNELRLSALRVQQMVMNLGAGADPEKCANAGKAAQ